MSTHAQKKLTFKDIQLNPEYVYGIGNGATVNEASQRALEDLVSSISTSIESSYDYNLASKQVDNDFSTHVDAKSMVKAYSKMTLNFTKQLVLSSDKDKVKTVVRYITRADLQEMFDKRSEKVKFHVKTARRATKNSEPAKALRHYYWAIVLMASYPDGNKLQIDDDDFTPQYAYAWIPRQMKALLSDISITPVDAKIDNDEKVVTLAITYRGLPIDDIQFGCTDGTNAYANISVTKNGQATLYIPREVNEKKLTACIDYTGRDEALLDQELADVIDTAQFLTFKEAEICFGRDIVIACDEIRDNAATPIEMPTAVDTPEMPMAGDTATRNDEQGQSIIKSSDMVAMPTTTPASEPKHELQQRFAPITAETQLYCYCGETEKGKPCGKGLMTFKQSGTFDGINVQKGDFFDGDFFDGHVYMVSHYDYEGNLKSKNIIRGM